MERKEWLLPQLLPLSTSHASTGTSYEHPIHGMTARMPAGMGRCPSIHRGGSAEKRKGMENHHWRGEAQRGRVLPMIIKSLLDYWVRTSAHLKEFLVYVLLHLF
jgi:hypothetical protein